ncbi:phosphopantothenoylcysteine decarboxylase/phosphopantothenate--cysteine ligase [Tumebacillus sp. BK434]|uniref:bifunctional phosphopantothenoylcysteine decarboxylase/phosphopantothenate--cysteine ligase CoaBC n=1 Tax=Tumebacillus sp. BK434 TaxID=2512169 RepID=UPI001053E063|nr:bifunctional phosphopantothenoylcysteine decarboxylase/phosphopantothenate--cysteine ligase CoaBC [Tumebacillus sp. BK434]TCP52451.1 phosphopantothenoylcysteine decarboxylase/phosphopantothenate--cysteine ligase [Tumebacillus sp. BK434]
MIKGKTIVLGVAGGIAAFKAALLASLLTKAGANVHVIMTESAQKFITPLTFQSLTKKPVHLDTFTEPDPSELAHIALADKANLIVVAPTTANVIGKVAHGLADDMLTTTIMASKAPVLFAVAMNVNMYDNPIVQDNIRYLQEKGYLFAEPGVGYLACGWTGKGRLMEPEEIGAWIEAFFAEQEQRQDLNGLRVLITAGRNAEPIDPVRFITNRSTGKMGYALAEAAVQRGAEVTLVTGPSELLPPPGVTTIRVQTGLEMHDAVMTHVEAQDVIIGAAAVADYRPKLRHEQKLKKKDGPLTIEFERNPDILLEVGKRKRADQVLVGFAAETEQVLENARGKLERKHADLFVANDVSQAGAGFGTDTNIVTLVDRHGDTPLPLLSKREVADRILDRVQELRRQERGPVS